MLFSERSVTKWKRHGRATVHDRVIAKNFAGTAVRRRRPSPFLTPRGIKDHEIRLGVVPAGMERSGLDLRASRNGPLGASGFATSASWRPPPQTNSRLKLVSAPADRCPCLGSPESLALGFVFLDHAVPDGDDTVRVLGDVVFMGHEDDRITFRVQAIEQRHDLITGL